MNLVLSNTEFCKFSVSVKQLHFTDQSKGVHEVLRMLFLAAKTSSSVVFSILKASRGKLKNVFNVLQVDGISGMSPYSHIDAQGTSSLAVPLHASNLMKSVSTPSIPSADNDSSHGKGNSVIL